jgi:CheY-like chemotaxis protein
MNADSLRILYADDDVDDLEFMQEGLRQIAPAHTLHCVKYAENFIAEVKEFQPSLIFLDYNMPVCNGKDCLEATGAQAYTYCYVLQFLIS